MREWLINLRKSKKMTQSGIADQVGISRAYYTQLELSQRSPSIRVAKRLADALEFDWTIFFDDVQYPGLKPDD